MPKPKADTTVTLGVTGAAPPDDTWKPCKTTGGGTDGFWYKFTGGNSGNDDGSWDFTVDSSGNGTKFIDVEIQAADGWDPSNPTTSPGYRITSMPISYDGNVDKNKQDVSVQDESDPRCWRLKNKNKDAESGEFKVIVSYTPPGSNPQITRDIECDPGWRNKN